MKARNVFLLLGILLSITSKVLQIRFRSLWGDILILPAATLFVLAILLSIPVFENWLRNAVTRRKAIFLTSLCCLVVLSFQLFTMFTFGQGQQWGFIFILPILLFLGLAVKLYLSIKQT